MRLQDERHKERGRTEDASNIDAHTSRARAAARLRHGRSDERATYEDPSELDMETRLAAHTSCERWKVVVAGPERLRRAPPPPSTRDTRAVRPPHRQPSRPRPPQTPAQHTFRPPI